MVETNSSSVNQSAQFIEKYVSISETLAQNGYVKESVKSGAPETSLFLLPTLLNLLLLCSK